MTVRITMKIMYTGNLSKLSQLIDALVIVKFVHRCGRTGRAGKDGCAWTFLTPEQGRYAGDILRALEQSGATVPEDLQKLWESYKLAQEADGKKVHTGGGFSGKGNCEA